MKAQSKNSMRSWLIPIVIGIVIIVPIVALISNSNYTDTVYRKLHNHQPVRKIELRVITREDSNFLRTILDKAVLAEFETVLQGGEKITFDAPRMHTVFIDMEIYKAQKINISVLKSMQNGWVVSAGKDWYKNDSLIQLLTPYLSPNAH